MPRANALRALARAFGRDATLRARADATKTLVAVADGDRSYRFDIRLQGADETVFLEFP